MHDWPAGKPVAEPEELSARVRILVAAEGVFAQHGFDGGSLRQVAVGAGVPVGLVSYHFASKIGLYRAVFEARVPSLVEQRLAGLAIADLESDPDRRMELTVKSLFIPMLKLRETDQGRRFATLLVREVMDPASADRGILRSLLSPVSEAFMLRFKSLLDQRSHLDPDWAYAAVIGAMLFIVGGGGRLRQATGGRFDPDDGEAATKHLTAFVLAALRA